MSEKTQCTATSLREKMLRRYDDELFDFSHNHKHHKLHKHNKYHLSHREHCRTHPSHPPSYKYETLEPNGDATGLLRQLKLRKMRKRSVGRVH